MSKDVAAIEQLATVGADLTVPHTLLHYIYMPDSEAAEAVARELRARGFRTEERLGADNANWLVLARHEMMLSEESIASMRGVLETLVARNGGGEYDGWEVEVRSAKLTHPPGWRLACRAAAW